MAQDDALRSELRDLKVTALKRRAREAGVDDAELEATDDADDSKQAVIELIVEKQRSSGSMAQDDALRSELRDLKVTALKRRAREAGERQKPPDSVLAALQAGGDAAVELIGSVFDTAVRELEEQKRCSPRKGRRSMTNLIARIESFVDLVDDGFCDGVSQSDELEHLAHLLAAVQSSSVESTGLDTSTVHEAVVELLECVERCGPCAHAKTPRKLPPLGRTPPTLTKQPPALPRSSTPPRPLRGRVSGSGARLRSATPPRAKP
eukprot:COSAG02_NODE_15662_length_1150_cov_2.641294_1_plen_264_part_00